MGVNIPGENDGERNYFVIGYRMGMFAAIEMLRALSKEAGEVAGACPCGPYLNAANYIEARFPKGEVVTIHELR